MPDPIKPTAADKAAWYQFGYKIFVDEMTGPEVLALHAQQAREQALESLPDEIDLFRLLRRAGRKDIDKARAVDAAIRALKEQPPC